MLRERSVPRYRQNGATLRLRRFDALQVDAAAAAWLSWLVRAPRDVHRIVVISQRVQQEPAMRVVGEALPNLACEGGPVAEHFLCADPLSSTDTWVQRKLDGTLYPVVLHVGAI